MNYEILNNELKAFTEKAIDLSLDALSEGGTFSPFILHGKDGKKLSRLQMDSTDEMIETAQEFIEELDDGSNTVVLCYKDSIRLNDGESDAIITQIYGVDEDSGYSFGQLYRFENGKIQLANNKIFLGNIRNCLVF